MFKTVLAFLPMLSLLFCILILKLEIRRSAALALLIAISIGATSYNMGLMGLGIALGKGMVLSLYVLLIIWSAVFFYHIVDEVRGVEVISQNISLLIGDKFTQFLFLSWIFSCFLQAVAGFGVPGMIIAPILIGLGFSPLLSISAVLIGHSWGICFASMGSPFYILMLITGVSGGSLIHWMAVFAIILIFLSGLAVSYMYGGIPYIGRGLYYTIPGTIFMGLVIFLLIRLDLIAIIGLLTSVAGIVFILALYRFKDKATWPKKLYKNKVSLGEAVFPYIVIIFLSLLFQIIPLEQLTIAFNFPKYITASGRIIQEEVNYGAINLLNHPTTIILSSAIIGIYLYSRKGVWDRKQLKIVVVKTVDKCLVTSLGLTFLMAMSLIMVDSGMMDVLASNIAKLTVDKYPIIAPFIGIIGGFITGSNSNANVIFGNFQESIAYALGVNGAVMCAIQSIGAAIGGSIGPTQILLGASSSGLIGREESIYKKTIPFIFLSGLILGLTNYFILINI